MSSHALSGLSQDDEPEKVCPDLIFQVVPLSCAIKPEQADGIA